MSGLISANIVLKGYVEIYRSQLFVFLCFFFLLKYRPSFEFFTDLMHKHFFWATTSLPNIIFVMGMLERGSISIHTHIYIDCYHSSLSWEERERENFERGIFSQSSIGVIILIWRVGYTLSLIHSIVLLRFQCVWVCVRGRRHCHVIWSGCIVLCLLVLAVVELISLEKALYWVSSKEKSVLFGNFGVCLLIS